jgi:hypothetical protein
MKEMMEMWKSVLIGCLVIAICFTMASAAIESPFTKSSFDKSSAIAFADAKASAMETMKTGIEEPVVVSPVTIQKPDFSGISRDLTVPEITRPAFNPLPAPTIPVPGPTSGNMPSDRGYPRFAGYTITQKEAIEIALAQYPGMYLKTPPKALLWKAPGSTDCYWMVMLMPGDPKCSDITSWKYAGFPPQTDIELCTCYFGITVFIDPITGEIVTI